jgi:hypothetical protein
MVVVASGRRGTVSRGAAEARRKNSGEMSNARRLDDITEAIIDAAQRACDASSTISLPPRRRVSA